MEDTERYYKKLVEALKLISIPLKEQQKYFPEFVDVPFEITDTFEKAFYLLPQILEANKIDYNVIPNLLRLHNLINLDIYNFDFDSLSSEELYNSSDWNRMIILSKDILKIMNIPLEKPDNNYI
ncbi:hypothetical protein [Empedobacter brevis]|uniref:hypothetical protein n=1 Tax=Empedobacter brevis TaxID=247 RepID=UPI0028A1B2EC|nr:hypothetical protein [Empedobacter brevis]